MAVKYKRRNYSRSKEGDEIEKEYATIVHHVASTYKNKNEQENVVNILSDEDAHRAYLILKEEEWGPEDIAKVMGESLHSLAMKKGIRPSAYLTRMAGKLREFEDSEVSIERMYQQKMISERTYEQVIRDIGERHRHHKRKTNSGLEAIARRAAAIILILSGALVGIASQFTLTGAAVGSWASPTVTLMISILMFVLGLLIYPRR